MMVDGRKIPVSVYYAGRGKDGQVQTCSKPHNAALLTEVLAEALVIKLSSTHHCEVCELLCDENSTVHDNMVSIGEAPAPAAPAPTTLQDLSKAIERCFREGGLSPLEAMPGCNLRTTGSERAQPCPTETG